jgi:hypothetical protein
MWRAGANFLLGTGPTTTDRLGHAREAVRWYQHMHDVEPQDAKIKGLLDQARASLELAEDAEASDESEEEEDQDQFLSGTGTDEDFPQSPSILPIPISLTSVLDADHVRSNSRDQGT